MPLDGPIVDFHLAVVAFGSGLGLVLGSIAGRLISASRFGLPAVDPLVFGGSAAISLIIGLVACSVPVLRASRINLMDALRNE